MGMYYYGYGYGWHGWGLILMAAVLMVPLWKIVSRAGFNGALALLALVPVVNVVALWVFAFSAWPAQKRDT